jgi:hypothetical protein
MDAEQTACQGWFAGVYPRSLAKVLQGPYSNTHRDFMPQLLRSKTLPRRGKIC